VKNADVYRSLLPGFSLRKRAVLGCCLIAVSALSTAAAQSAGPEILYAPPASAPQLENGGIWQAAPILIAGASAYRDGEFLYQDFLYDDLGASSSLNYPADPAYAGNAADFVELRLKPLADHLAIRITYNSMIDPDRAATTIVLGTSSAARALPHGANTRAPGSVFVTVRGSVADAIDAASGTLIAGAAPAVTVDLARRQVEVRVPYTVFDPRGSTAVRVAAATGLWDWAQNRYLAPAGSTTTSSVFFNAAFRFDEPLVGGITSMRESQQSAALANGDLSAFFAEVDFMKLAAGVDDDRPGQRAGVPVTGFMNRIFASHFETKQGRGDAASLQPSACVQPCAPLRAGRLQSYSIYVPSKPLPAAGYGLTLMLHASGGTASSYQGSQGAIQLGERGAGSIVLTPDARGPSYFYYGQAAADVFEAWDDVARWYPLDAGNTIITGVSMGGYGAYKLAALYPDLFAAVVAVVPCGSAGVLYVPGGAVPGGEASAIASIADSLRHVPAFSAQSSNDPVCTYGGPAGSAAVFQRLDALGYRYEARNFMVAEHALVGSLLANNPGPFVDFVNARRVASDPAHVTYVMNEEMSQDEVGMTADHVYWISALEVRNASGALPIGRVDAISRGFGTADPPQVATQSGFGLWPGALYPFNYQRENPAPLLSAPIQNRVDLTVSNISELTIDPVRARIGCDAVIAISTDGPVTVTLAGCGRQVTAP
jgi:pimeloyl-ACP methyl ester carboxylesterase